MNDLKIKEFQSISDFTPSLITIGKCEVGVIDTHEKHCYKHNQDYTSQCLKLPSGKLQWTDCPICYINIDRRVRIERPIAIPEQPEKPPKSKGF